MTDEAALLLLENIVFWGRRLAGHIEGIDASTFEKSTLHCDASCWCLVCIGEAAGKLRQSRPDLAQEHADLELSKAYATRNRIAHGYDNLDVGLLWGTVTESVPALVRNAETAISALAKR